MSKFITALHASNMWASLMLVLAKITEKYNFDATVYVYSYDN